jgi:ribosomal protein S18 acetylase RimI-like enzyme
MASRTSNSDISLGAGFAAALAARKIDFKGFIEILMDNALARLDREDAVNRPEPISERILPKVNIRRTRPKNKPKIMLMLKDMSVFRTGELKVAQEVLDDALAHSSKEDYKSYVATENKDIVGWICFGPVPCTLGTFEIYCLVVIPSKQHCGVGSYLMQYATNLIENQKGRMIVVETSGSNRYLSARQFYEKIGYREVSRIRNFYTTGDDKVVYIMHLEPSRNANE